MNAPHPLAALPIGRPRALSLDEKAIEDREETQLCDVDTLTDWLSCGGRVFVHSYWLASAARIAADYADAENFGSDELLALLMLSPDARVVMACRDELKARYLARGEV